MDYQMHGMHTGQKKLVIKGFRGPRALPKNYEQESWSKLEEAVKAIQSRSTFVRYSLEKLNQIVSNLVDGNTDLANRIHSVCFSPKNFTGLFFFILAIETSLRRTYQQ